MSAKQIEQLDQEIHPQATFIYENLEKPNWAPWLRFTAADIAEHHSSFPEGQFISTDEVGNPVVALTTTVAEWDGSTNGLGTWDEYAGVETSFTSACKPNGNSLVFLSMSGSKKGHGKSNHQIVISDAMEFAKVSGKEHVIGDFRPSGFGAYKSATGDYNFEEYCIKRRDDGQRVDGWLRALERMNMHPLRADARAMVVPASTDELESYRSEWKPEAWREVTDSSAVEYLLSWHQPDKELNNVTEIWECGETGTWYVDTEAGEAVYIESNLWGELPIDENKSEVEAYRYDLNKEELDVGQAELLRVTKEAHPDSEFVAIWIEPDHPSANLIRTIEGDIFPEITKLVSNEVEQRSLFLAVVDQREGQKRLVHGTRVSGPKVRPTVEMNSKDSVGLVGVDEIIASDQGFSAADFYDYYESRGTDLQACFSVETNFRIGERTETNNGLRVSDLGYIAIFNMLEKVGAESGKSFIFAFFNQATLKSLGALGITAEPLAGRKELKAPSEDGKFDDHYEPVAININEQSLGVFRAIAPFGAPEITLSS